MIPQCGVESAPADLSAYSVVRFVREQLDCPVGDFDFAVHDFKLVIPSPPRIPGS